MVVVDGDLHHQAVQRQRPGVVGDDQRPALGRDVLDALHLDAEVLLVERADQGHQYLVGEFGVVTEVVDLVVARQPPAQEGQTAGDAPLQTTALLRLLGRLFLTRHGNIIPRYGPAGQGLDLTYHHGLALAPAARAPAARRALHRTPARPVVVERNDLGVRHR